MRKITLFFLAFLFVINYTNGKCYAAAPSTAARGAVVMDVASGRVLYQKNPHLKMPMASTTKIMTAIIAIEKGNLNDIVTVSDNASGVEGSSIWLAKGEKMSLENLLYGLMLQSGNDAAVAIAEHIGGSVKGFIDLMNEKALQLGAKNTHFVTPNGLHDAQHYTTAYDLALISAYAMKNPVFQKIVSTKYRKIPWEGHEWDRVLKNKNDILWQYEGGNGIKTGYTTVSRRCLASAAIRSNMQIVCIVLNCQPWFDDSMALMDYAFKTYKPYTILKKGDNISTIPIMNGTKDQVQGIVKKDIIIPLKEDEIEKIQVKINSSTSLKAPIKANTRIGSVLIRLGEEINITEGIYTTEDIEKNTFIYNLEKIIKQWSPYNLFSYKKESIK